MLWIETMVTSLSKFILVAIACSAVLSIKFWSEMVSLMDIATPPYAR